METLIKQGRGDALVPSGGCTEPGGGIVPTTRTAHQMAADLRGLIQLIRCPDQVMLSGTPLVGFGQAEIVAPAAVATSPWAVALATSVVGAATGWVIEEIATRVRGRRRQ
jgi:hypothetical protein